MSEGLEDGVPKWIEKKVVPTTQERVRSIHLLKEGGLRKSAILFTDAHAMVAERSAVTGVKVYDVAYPPGLLINGMECPHCGKVVREPVRKVATVLRPGKAAAKPTEGHGGPGLTAKQLAQRKYASRMKGVRKRAAQAPGGGKTPAAEREAARKLRKKLGIQRGK